MTPMCPRTLFGSRSISNPPIFTSPEVLAKVVVIMEMVVVFPAPFGPKNEKNSPSDMEKEIPSTAFLSAFLYLFFRFFTSITFAI